MQTFRIAFTLTTAVLTLGTQAHAQSAKDVAPVKANTSNAPNVEELVRLALQRSPSLASARARQASAREQVCAWFLSSRIKRVAVQQVKRKRLEPQPLEP